MTSRKSDDNGKVSCTFSKLGGAHKEISVIYFLQQNNNLQINTQGVFRS